MSANILLSINDQHGTKLETGVFVYIYMEAEVFQLREQPEDAVASILQTSDGNLCIKALRGDLFIEGQKFADTPDYITSTDATTKKLELRVDGQVVHLNFKLKDQPVTAYESSGFGENVSDSELSFIAETEFQDYNEPDEIPNTQVNVSTEDVLDNEEIIPETQAPITDISCASTADIFDLSGDEDIFADEVMEAVSTSKLDNTGSKTVKDPTELDKNQQTTCSEKNAYQNEAEGAVSNIQELTTYHKATTEESTGVNQDVPGTANMKNNAVKSNLEYDESIIHLSEESKKAKQDKKRNRKLKHPGNSNGDKDGSTDSKDGQIIPSADSGSKPGAKKARVEIVPKSSNEALVTPGTNLRASKNKGNTNKVLVPRKKTVSQKGENRAYNRKNATENSEPEIEGEAGKLGKGNKKTAARPTQPQAKSPAVEVVVTANGNEKQTRRKNTRESESIERRQTRNHSVQPSHSTTLQAQRTNRKRNVANSTESLAETYSADHNVLCSSTSISGRKMQKVTKNVEEPKPSSSENSVNRFSKRNERLREIHQLIQRIRQSGRKIKISMSMCNNNMNSVLNSLKDIIEVSEDPVDSDILLMDFGERTFKFLVCVALNKPILKSSWLTSIMETRLSQVRQNDVFRDDIFEREFNYDPTASTTNNRVLNGYNFVLMDGIRPEVSKMKVIIECAGGKILSQIQKRLKNLYVVCQEDTVLKNKSTIPHVLTECIMQAVVQRNRSLITNFVLNSQ